MARRDYIAQYHLLSASAPGNKCIYEILYMYAIPTM